MPIDVQRGAPRPPWRFAAPAEKLLARGGLPGAFGYDLAADALRAARRAGVSVRALLAPALPGSWMVNARVASPTFRRWLEPPLAEAFADLARLTGGGPAAWLARPTSERRAAEEAAAALAVDGQGAAAISKALALLSPETVPLMDDAALHLAVGFGAAPPASADDPRAGPEWVVPMLDWFATAVRAAEAPLADLARGYPLAPLEPAQVLDRLIWFDSFGFRLFNQAGRGRWAQVAADGVEAVVRETDLPGR